MSRVKRGVTSHAKHKKVYKAAKGFYGRRKNTIRAAKAAVDKAGQYAFRDRKRKKRTFRALVDPAPQRRGAPVRHDLQRLHQRPLQVGHHGGPQGAVGSRHPRAGGVPGDRREGQGRAGGVVRIAAALATPVSCPAQAGHPVTTDQQHLDPGLLGSSAFADDDGLPCWTASAAPNR